MAKKEDTLPPESEIEIIDNSTEGSSSKDTPNVSPEILKAFAPYVAFLEAMRVTKKHIDVAPTFTPKNFYDQIQLFDDGAVRRLYLYINGDWRYVALT